MDWMTWYESLAKPGWTPAPATIGLIWQILYPIIAVSFGFVFVQTVNASPAASSIVRPMRRKSPCSPA